MTNRRLPDSPEEVVEHVAMTLGVDAAAMGHGSELAEYIRDRDRVVARDGDPTLYRLIVTAHGFGRCGRAFKASIERPNDTPQHVDAVCRHTDREGDQKLSAQCPNCATEGVRARERLVRIAQERVDVS